MIKTTAEGWSVIEGDTHHARWVEECRNIVHDPFMAGVVRRLVKPGKTAVDAGANIGTLTVAMSDAGAGHILAIDPNEEALECLRRNMRKHNPACSVTAFNFPLWAYSGEQFGFDVLDNVGASYMAKTGLKIISSRTLSDICDEEVCTDIGFIKLDIEGCELMALYGGIRHIIDNRPNLLVEVNRGALDRNAAMIQAVSKDSVGDLRNFLQMFYKNVDIVQPDCNWGSPQFDVACY